MSIADFMRQQPSGSDINYPLIHDAGDRIQIVYGEKVYGMLIRYADLWCGYALLSQQQAEDIDDWRPMLGASFLGPAATPITWFAPNRFGMLDGPSSLLVHSGGDFWIGFHERYVGDPELERILVVNHLGRFVDAVQKVLVANANPPV